MITSYFLKVYCKQYFRDNCQKSKCFCPNSKKIIWVSVKCNFKIDISSQSTNLSDFEKKQNDSGGMRGTLISPAGTGLWKNYSFIYLNDQLKAELTVCRTFSPKPEPDALLCIREYARDAFSKPIIAEENFFFYRICCFYDCSL